MSANDWWAQQFEENRGHLRAVAYRMLGSTTEADDAVQEAWLRLSRSDATSIDNLGGWLTTVVARVCLDALRSRASRHEESLTEQVPEPALPKEESNPEQQALLADSLGLAFLVVLERLAPAERIAFVLHDMFDVSFDEIAPIVGRSSTAARQLASRARRRVRGAAHPAPAEYREQRQAVDGFLSALRRGDFEGLLKVLDPDVVVNIGAGAGAAGGAPRVIHGAQAWATGAIAFRKAAAALEPVLIDGAVGLVWAPGGHLKSVAKFTVKQDKIVAVEIIADQATLSRLDLTLLS